MTTTTHTAGPWNVEPHNLGKWIKSGESFIVAIPDHIEHEGKPCGSIASQDKTQDELDANARLIAAAPELLAALEALTEWGCTHTSPRDANSPHDFLVAARAAIAKATN